MYSAASTAPVPHIVPAWRVLIVDDDESVHAVTKLALEGFAYRGRPLELLHAGSAAEARQILAATPDVAMILLDVVMETEQAGLELVSHIRDELENPAVRIILRTGQPGQAPPLEVTARYDIDDYRTKTELTHERLLVLTQTALRTYEILCLLATRNEELERFSYVASHDMKSPLRGMVSFAEILERRCGPQLRPEDAEMLRFIGRGARQLQALIDDLLDYSRLGRDPTPPETVALDHVLQRALHNLKLPIDERAARVESEPLPHVRGNPVQLERLLRNLIDNGLKFQPGPAPKVSLSAQRAGDHWEIRIRDHGIGIEPEHLERIFEPFHRLHSADRFPGSGIGLSVCRNMARLHGGTLRAESVVGMGTTFVLALPVLHPVGWPEHP